MQNNPNLTNVENNIFNKIQKAYSESYDIKHKLWLDIVKYIYNIDYEDVSERNGITFSNYGDSEQIFLKVQPNFRIIIDKMSKSQ